MKKVLKSLFAIKRRSVKDERAYTLLEYCAGAAVVLTIIWGALTAMGGNLADMLDSIGSWATKQATEISADS